jgi:hypothetical protein
MATKSNPGVYDCYADADPDEPIFVLLGRDRHAPGAVRQWAYDRAQAISRGEKPIEDRAKVTEALECADAMERYAVTRSKACQT